MQTNIQTHTKQPTVQHPCAVSACRYLFPDPKSSLAESDWGQSYSPDLFVSHVPSLDKGNSYHNVCLEELLSLDNKINCV